MNGGGAAAVAGCCWRFASGIEPLEAVKERELGDTDS